jgi:hypothetical protein
MTTRTSLGLLLCGLLIPGAAMASQGPPPKLNPKTYVSASGEYSLLVDPTDSYGRGAANCRLTKNGKAVWQCSLPYTFWEAVVSDRGQVAGYAYTSGPAGFAKNGRKLGAGEFVMAVLSSDGKILNEEKHNRETSRFLDYPPTPLAAGIILDGMDKRSIVRISDSDINRRSEQWWIFDLTSGKRVGKLEPGESMSDGIMLRARAVPGTSLVLTHAWSYASGNSGGAFSLVDLDDSSGEAVWGFALDADYSVPGDEKAEDELRAQIWKEGAILDTNKSPGFAIYCAKEQKRIAFSIKKADGKWRVHETGRTDHKLPSAKAPRPAGPIPKIELQEAGAVRLVSMAARKESPIRDIEGFGFDADGRLCVLSVRKYVEPHLLQVDQRGRVLKDIRLLVGKLPEVNEWAGPVNVGGQRFVVTLSNGEEEGKARCFVADFAEATVSEVQGFDSFTITALAGFPDGRFAALVEHRMRYTRSEGLSLFDAEGKSVWQDLGAGHSGKQEDLLSPEDIACYGKDSIAVLDVIRHTIQLFGTKGDFRESIDLNKAWGREPSYPTRLIEDAAGGFVVHDFDAEFPLVRTDAKGRIRAQFVPKSTDGRRLSVQSVQRAPDGRLWITDREIVARLSDTGTVDRILGEVAVSSAIYQLDCAKVGPNDRVYVADRRTKAVHVFDSSGKWLGVCVPDPKSIPVVGGIGCIAVSPQGEVFYSGDVPTDQFQYHFDDKMRWRGKIHLDVDTIRQELYFQPSGPLSWVQGYEEVILLRDLRTVVRKITRRADRKWLEHPSALGVAPDGSIAVVARSETGEVSLNTYDPKGEPRTTYVGPKEWTDFGGVAYDGETVFFRNGNILYVVAKNDRCVGMTRLPCPANNPWEGPFLAAHRTQLWFVDREGPTLRKFVIPSIEQARHRPR